ERRRRTRWGCLARYRDRSAGAISTREAGTGFTPLGPWRSVFRATGSAGMTRPQGTMSAEVSTARTEGAGTLTWLGPGCAATRLDDTPVVTDPVLRDRIVHLRRKSPVNPAALAGVDVVLLSHIHHDHLDLPSLDRLDPDAQVLVPSGAGGL